MHRTETAGGTCLKWQVSAEGHVSHDDDDMPDCTLNENIKMCQM